MAHRTARSLKDTIVGNSEKILVSVFKVKCLKKITFVPNDLIQREIKKKFRTCAGSHVLSAGKWSELNFQQLGQTRIPEKSPWNFLLYDLAVHRSTLKNHQICQKKINAKNEENPCSTCLLNPFLHGTSKTRNPGFGYLPLPYPSLYPTMLELHLRPLSDHCSEPFEKVASRSFF